MDICRSEELYWAHASSELSEAWYVAELLRCIVREDEIGIKSAWEGLQTNIETIDDQARLSLLKDFRSDYEDDRARTPLSLAAGRGLDNTAQELIISNQGIDIQHADSRGRTALIWAARNGHAKVAETLLRNGADIEAQDIHARTPLISAAKKGHDQVVEKLLSKNADPFAMDKDRKMAIIHVYQNIGSLADHSARPTVIHDFQKRMAIPSWRAESRGTLAWKTFFDTPLALSADCVQWLCAHAILDPLCDETTIENILNSPFYFALKAKRQNHIRAFVHSPPRTSKLAGISHGVLSLATILVATAIRLMSTDRHVLAIQEFDFLLDTIQHDVGSHHAVVLGCAIREGQSACLRSLLERGADPSRRILWPISRQHNIFAMSLGLWSNFLGLVRRPLYSPRRVSPLLIAAAYPDFALVQVLLEYESGSHIAPRILNRLLREIAIQSIEASFIGKDAITKTDMPAAYRHPECRFRVATLLVERGSRFAEDEITSHASAALLQDALSSGEFDCCKKLIAAGAYISHDAMETGLKDLGIDPLSNVLTIDGELSVNELARLRWKWIGLQPIDLQLKPMTRDAYHANLYRMKDGDIDPEHLLKRYGYLSRPLRK